MFRSLKHGAKKLINIALLAKSGKKEQSQMRKHSASNRVVKPKVSIIVPAYNVAPYIVDCLKSLSEQRYINIEIIVINDGSTDATEQRVRECIEGDNRIKLFNQVNGGLSRARNAGVARASGSFLCFVDSDDELEPDYIATAVETLLTTESDFVVVGYSRFNSSRAWKAARWIQEAHKSDRMAVTLQQAPDILVNAMACSKLIRKSFWDKNDLGFVPGVTYEDQIFSATLYTKARQFDILEKSFYKWRDREDRSSITQRIGDPEDFTSRISAAVKAREILEDYDQEVSHLRIGQILSNDLTVWLRQIPKANEVFWDALVAGLSALTSGEPEGVWSGVAPQHRLVYKTILDKEYDKAIWLFENNVWDLRSFKTVENDGTFVIEPAEFTLPASLSDVTLRQLQPHQMDLRARLTRGHWSNEKLVIDGYAFINRVDPELSRSETTIFLVSQETGDEFPISSTVRRCESAELASDHPYHDYSRMGFRIEIDQGLLLSMGTGLTRRWQFAVQVSSGSELRRQPLSVQAASGLFALGSRNINGWRISPIVDRNRGFTLRANRPSVLASASDDSDEVELTSADSVGLTHVVAFSGDTRVDIPATPRLSKSGVIAVVDLEDLRHLPSGIHKLRAKRADGSLRPIAWDGITEDLPREGRIRFGATQHENLELINDTNIIEVIDAYKNSDNELTLEFDSNVNEDITFGVIIDNKKIELGSIANGLSQITTGPCPGPPLN